MSSFCTGGKPASIPSFTDVEINETFPNGVLPDLSSLTLTDGLASQAWLEGQIKTLETNKQLPITTKIQNVASTPFNSPDSKDPLNEYVTRENDFTQQLKAEYCFYEVRYFAALDRFLQAVADASLRNDKAVVIQQRLDTARKLNQKLNVLTQLVNAISKHRYRSTEKFNQEINNINNGLKSRGDQLIEQAKILEKETAAADLHKRMVEYTVEKNKANTNLLGMYAVLNVVALGMIFYIARAV
jgi:hypothetical protein